MPSPLRGMRQTSPPWHVAMPSGGGIHSISATADSRACARPASFGSRRRTSGRTGSTKPDGLVADVDPALGQQIFDVSKRQRVSNVHHDDQTDDLWRAVEISE